MKIKLFTAALAVAFTFALSSCGNKQKAAECSQDSLTCAPAACCSNDTIQSCCKADSTKACTGDKAACDKKESCDKAKTCNKK